MVYLALSPDGAKEALRAARTQAAAVWAGSDAFTSQERESLWADGVKFTVFNYSLVQPTPEVIASALATIEEHHPGEIIWVEHAPGTQVR